MMRKLIVTGLLIGFSFSVLAEPNLLLETDREQVALARIYTVLSQLTPLIDEAKRVQNKQARIQFRYEALEQDIEHIKQGIDQKFHPSSIEPRIILPIQGDYLNFRHSAK